MEVLYSERMCAERVMHNHSLLLSTTVYHQLKLQLYCAGSCEGLLSVKAFSLCVHQTVVASASRRAGQRGREQEKRERRGESKRQGAMHSRAWPECTQEKKTAASRSRVMNTE